jgi:hypothetical protein
MKAVAQVLLTRVEEVMKVSRSLAESGNNQDLEMIDSMISTLYSYLITLSRRKRLPMQARKSPVRGFRSCKRSIDKRNTIRKGINGINPDQRPAKLTRLLVAGLPTHQGAKIMSVS